MYSYEIVYEHVDHNNGSTESQVNRNSVKYTTTTKFIVANDHKDVLKYVTNEINQQPEYELVAIVRRNPIITVIKGESDGN